MNDVVHFSLTLLVRKFLLESIVSPHFLMSSCLPPPLRHPGALPCSLVDRPGGAAVGAKASPERRCAILRELGLQIRTHRSGGLRCGGTCGGVNGLGCVRDGADSVERRGGANGGEGNAADPRDKEDETKRGRGGGPLSLLCGRADRLLPWPALAWWAATLPGSTARGGVTAWVRLVAFAVRVVMSRAASVVAVDVDSFRAAAPPGHRVGVTGDAGVGSGGEPTGQRRRTGAVRGLRRGEELEEDGAAMCHDGVAGWADNGEDEATRGDGGRGGAAENVVVVLLPTHRSYLDFVLVSLFCASMRSFPGLSWLRVPKVAAADGPFGKEGTPLRWLMEKLGKRGASFF